MKGLFNKIPIVPIRNEVWNPEIVLNFLKKWSPVKLISFKQLSMKLAMLLLLTTGQRCQTLLVFKVDQMTLTKNKVTFVIDELLKTNKPGFLPKPITIEAYPSDRRICVITYLREYVSRTSKVRIGKHLLISTTKPHKRISQDTLRRWVRMVMSEAGINIEQFTAHSTRSASANYALTKGMSLNKVLDTVGWRTTSTFQKYYKKKVMEKPKDSFSHAILQS